MKLKNVLLLVVGQVLAVGLAAVAFFIGAFASDSGAADPSGQRFSQWMLAVVGAVVACSTLAWVLAAFKRNRFAAAMMLIPFLLFAAIFAANGVGLR